MTLSNGAEEYVKTHAKNEYEAEVIRKAYYAGYLQSTENWCTKART